VRRVRRPSDGPERGSDPPSAQTTGAAPLSRGRRATRVDLGTGAVARRTPADHQAPFRAESGMPCGRCCGFRLRVPRFCLSGHRHRRAGQGERSMASVTHLAWELVQALGLGLVAMPVFATGLYGFARIAETLESGRGARATTRSEESLPCSLRRAAQPMGSWRRPEASGTV
jgi:hypothetical protein